MDRVTSRMIWPRGSWAKTCSMCAEHLPRARSNQTLKNRILLDNYYLPGDLERQISAFVEHYNHVRYHESIGNVAPADIYFGTSQNVRAPSASPSQTGACSIDCKPLKL